MGPRERARGVAKKVKDLMQTEVLTILESTTVNEALDVMTQARVHGVPVLDASGGLTGLISLTDVLFGGMTRSTDDDSLKVAEIMTSPAVTVGEEADVRDVCQLMADIGLHRIPVTRENRVVGLVSSIDICAAIARGDDL